MTRKVWIIGVDPPCPRCDVVRQRIERLTQGTDKQIEVVKMKYTDPEAREYAASIGKETGTATDVAKRAGLEIDWKQIPLLRRNPKSTPEDIHILTGTARQWSREFDEVLRPCQEKAESVSLLMTPIVVVDGQVKHHGSVPSIEQLKSWF